MWHLIRVKMMGKCREVGVVVDLLKDWLMVVLGWIVGIAGVVVRVVINGRGVIGVVTIVWDVMGTLTH
jgi:hypothetical protein